MKTLALIALLLASTPKGETPPIPPPVRKLTVDEKKAILREHIGDFCLRMEAKYGSKTRAKQIWFTSVTAPGESAFVIFQQTIDIPMPGDAGVGMPDHVTVVKDFGLLFYPAPKGGFTVLPDDFALDTLDGGQK